MGRRRTRPGLRRRTGRVVSGGGVPPESGYSNGNCGMNRTIRILGVTALTVAATSLTAALLGRYQMSRQRRHLFNPLALRRLAALEHMARQEATVNNINLLRDYITWEPRRLLRNRAMAVVERMEREAGGTEGGEGEERR